MSDFMGFMTGLCCGAMLMMWFFSGVEQKQDMYFAATGEHISISEIQVTKDSWMKQFSDGINKAQEAK